MSAWLEALQSVLPAETLEQAKEAEANGVNPVDFLLAQDSITEDDMLELMSRHYSLPAVSLRRYEPEKKAIEKVPHDIAGRLQLVPLFLLDEEMFVASSNPSDLSGQDFLRQYTGLSIQTVIATRGAIDEAYNRCYMGKEKSAQTIDAIAAAKQSAQTVASQIHIEDLEAPAIKLVNYILNQAVALGASDIHLESFGERALLRYRVDSVLHEFPPPPPHMIKTLVSRIKVMADMDTTDRRLPMDGRASFEVNERNYDLRISTIPTLHGEGVVIRILDPTGVRRDLAELGFNQAMLNKFEVMIRRPYGILLVAGPTGSGKTTTLYATLKKIFTPHKKFITLEDPVEYQLEGVTQMQVHSEIGLTFGAGLRSVLRQDPDVIMLGEIRDLESAEIAVRASLTGHLLFSSLHTNDAPLAITRLVDIGVQPFFVLSSLIGVLAQRLVRCLCVDCKTPIEPTPSQLELLGLRAVPEGVTLYGPKGCAACGNLGYRGRVGIYELLEINADMRRLPSDQLTSGTIRSMAMEKGFVTLRQSAMEKLYNGITSADEVLNLTTEE